MRYSGDRHCGDWVQDLGGVTTTTRLRITVRGDAAPEGRIALAELARIAGEIQAQVERVALVLTAGSSTGSGRRPGDVVEATQLDFVGFSSGSAVLDVEPHETQARLFDDEPELADRSLQRFVEGIGHLTEHPEHMPAGFDRGVINGLVDLTGSIGTRISSITLTLGDTRPVVVDARTKAAARTARTRLEQERVDVTGRLHMGDFAPSALRCRIDTANGPITCDFDEDLRSDVLAAMDRIVVATGLAEYWPSEDRPRRLHLEGLTQVQEAEETSLDQLIREQGVQPVWDINELAGPAIDDFDEFLTTVRSVRDR
jgi:hypothetical protein